MKNIKKLFLTIFLINTVLFLNFYAMEKNEEQVYKKFVSFLSKDAQLLCKKVTFKKLSEICNQKSTETLNSSNENYAPILRYIFIDKILLKKIEQVENLFTKIFSDKDHSIEIQKSFYTLLTPDDINNLNLSLDKIKAEKDLLSSLFFVLLQTSQLIKKSKLFLDIS